MMLRAALLRHDAKHKTPLQSEMTMVVPQRCHEEENERVACDLPPSPHELSPLPFCLLRLPTLQGRRRWRRDAGQTTSSGRLVATSDLCEGEVAKQGAVCGQGERREVTEERSVTREAASQGREATAEDTITSEASQWRGVPTNETVANDVADRRTLIMDDTVTKYPEGAVIRHRGGTVTSHAEEFGFVVKAVGGCEEALKRRNMVAKGRECKQDRGDSSRPGQSPSLGVLPSPAPQSSHAAVAVQTISLERWPSKEMTVLGHHLLHGLGPSPAGKAHTAYKRGNVEQLTTTTSSAGAGATHGGNAPSLGCEVACVTNLTRVRVTTTSVIMINGTSTLQESTLKQPQPRHSSSSQWLLTMPPQSLQTQLPPPDAAGIATRHAGIAFTAINTECLQKNKAGTNESKQSSCNNDKKDGYERRSPTDLYKVPHNLYKGKTREKSSRTYSPRHKFGFRLLLGLVDGYLADTLVRLALMFVLVSQSSGTAVAGSATFSSQQVSYEQGGGLVAFQLSQVDALPPPKNHTSGGAHTTKTPLALWTSKTSIDVNSTEIYNSKNNKPLSRSPPTDAVDETTSADGGSRVPTGAPEETSRSPPTDAVDETTSADGGSRVSTGAPEETSRSPPTDAVDETTSADGGSRVPTGAPEETSRSPPTDAVDETTSADGGSRVPTGAPEETSSHDGRSRANREAFRADVDPRYAGRTVRMVGTTWQLHRRLQKEREEAAARWAPVVWLHPQELYFPGDVHTFLAHVNSSDGDQTWERDGRTGRQYRLLPSGPDSEHMHLEVPIDTECCNCPVPSFLHGQRPVGGVGPPVYVHIHSCYAPEQHIPETSRIQYLLPAHSDGRSMRAQIHGLQHPLPRPPRYRRRRRHYITVRGRRDAQQAPDVATGGPNRGKDVPGAVSSEPYEAVDQTTTESPLNNFVEINQTSKGTQGMGEEGARVITKIGQFLKWNKVTLRKPQTKMLNLPDFKKTPHSNKDGRKINHDSNVLNEAGAAHSNHYSPTKGVDDTHSRAVTQVNQENTSTMDTQNIPESSSTSSEPPSNKFVNESNFDTRNDSSTSEVTVEHVEKDGPVTATSESQVTVGDSKHEKRNIDSSSYYGHNGGTGQQFRDKGAVTPVFLQAASQSQIPYPNTQGPTLYPNTGDYHSEKNTATETQGHHFTVTFWFFYPYNQGKAVCTSNVWLLGRVAKPLFHGKCLGQNIVMGNHVGDWEHVSIFFEHGTPKHLYISAHSFGAIYTYRPRSNRFEYVSQDVREGLPMRAEFPEHLDLEDGRLVLYSATGSHGLWPEEGNHPYNSMVVPLADETGQGTRWDTWHNLEMIDTVAQEDPEHSSLSRQWLGFRGRWGNPSSNCHPGLLGFCELRDGPTGIPTKRLNFPCHVPKHYTFPNK